MVKEQKKQVCDYVDSMLKTINPVSEELWRKPTYHPCKIHIKNVNSEELDSDYANLANCIEKHICSSAYCLRKKRQ